MNILFRVRVTYLQGLWTETMIINKMNTLVNQYTLYMLKN